MSEHIITVGQPKKSTGRPCVKIGDKWNFLTILSEGKSDKFGHKRVLCQCDCGTQKLCMVSSLRFGSTVSCGCYPRQMRKGSKLSYRRKSKYSREEAAIVSLYRQYASKAKQHGRQFGLTLKTFETLVKLPCAYCGRSPFRNFYRRGGTSRCECKVNGIDRVDSTKGYTDTNVVSCCWPCNTAKNSMTQDQFRAWVISVYSAWAVASNYDFSLEDFSI
jgi:hypothetical protein